MRRKRLRSLLLAAIALLAPALPAVSGTTPVAHASPYAVRVVKFSGGEAIVERRGMDEHVVVKRHGREVAISDCDTTTGTYDRVVAFASAVKTAARRGDRVRLASLMMYPVQVNVAPGKHVFVATKRALLARFDSVFDAQMLRKLAGIEPHEVFCRNGQSMLADGTLWASMIDGKLFGTVVNAQK